MNASRIQILFCLLACWLPPFSGAEEVAWPGIEYATVRAYLYHGQTFSEVSILDDGKINPSAEKVTRVPAEAARKIGGAMKDRPTGVASQTMCYEPHHAFVYFDREGKAVAWLEVCFDCRNARYSPKIPDERMWDQKALGEIFRASGIPIPGDAEYAEFRKASDGHNKAIEEAEKRLGESGFDLQVGEVPPEAAWPWRPFAKAKLYAFEGEERDWLVELGKVDAGVTKEVELTPAQRKEVWGAFRQIEKEKLNATEEISQSFVTGKYFVTTSADGTRKPWVPGPTKMRHGLVCFDEQGKPVAWLQLSFSDFSYFASPPDDLLAYHSIRWSPRRLVELFPKMGIPVAVPKVEASKAGTK